MKIHLVVIVVLASLLFVPSCLGKTVDQQPIKEVSTVDKVNYKIEKLTSTPKATPEPKPKEIVLPEFERQLIDLVNTERARQGLNKLKVVNKLNLAALYKAQDETTDNYFAHRSPVSGRNMWDFIWKAGYRASWAGENLAKGYTTPSEVMQGWMNSPTHKSNMLDPKFNEVGLSRYGDFIVLILAQPL